MNQCGRIPFPSVRILIFLRGAMSAISMMKLSSWPRSNLQGLQEQGIFAAALQPLCIPIPRCSPGRANILKSKVYECSLLGLSFPVLKSPAAVLLARHLSADLTGIPPSLENTAHPKLLQQPIAHIAVLFVARTTATHSQTSAHRLPPGTCTLACPWPIPDRRQNNFASSPSPEVEHKTFCVPWREAVAAAQLNVGLKPNAQI